MWGSGFHRKISASAWAVTSPSAEHSVLHGHGDAVNAVCEFSAKALSRNDGFAGKRIEVIENGIDVERYRNQPDRDALRKRLGLRLERRYVAMVARFHPGRPAVLAAVTGTNGKSSTVSFIRDLWTHAGHTAYSLGTLGLRSTGALHTQVESTFTTFDAKSMREAVWLEAGMERRR